MARCHVCENEYDKSMEVVMGQRRYTFDCFECAIHELAPECSKCGCRIIGHGAENSGEFYCGAHCAKQSGAQGIADRVS